MLILSFHLSYSQYPVKRLYRGDSVVIMKVSQADTINLLFNSYNNTINTLKDSLTIKKEKYDSIYKKIHYKEDSINLWKGKYQTSVDLFRLRPKAKSYQAEKLDFAQKIILIAIILVQFQSLK